MMRSEGASANSLVETNPVARSCVPEHAADQTAHHRQPASAPSEGDNDKSGAIGAASARVAAHRAGKRQSASSP